MEKPIISPGVKINQQLKAADSSTVIKPGVSQTTLASAKAIDQPAQRNPNSNTQLQTNLPTAQQPFVQYQTPGQPQSRWQNRPTSGVGSQKKSALLKKEFSLFKVSLNEKAFLAKHLATILKSGISLPESLRIVQKQAHGRLKNALADVIIKVEGGKALNVALSDHKNIFDPLFINMVKVGEKSGSLDDSLHHLSVQLTKDAKLISKVKSAALYPVIVLITAALVGGGVSYFILPKLAKLFLSFRANLPLTTKILLKFSYSLEHYALWWLSGILGAVALIYLLLKIPLVRIFYDWARLRTPIAGKLIKSLNLARFCLTLGTLLKNGVAIDEALVITRDAITSISYKKAITAVFSGINRGKTIAEGMENIDPKGHLFPITARSMIKVGETTGSLVDSLLYLSQFYEEEVDNITKDLSTSLEPILLVIIALIVAFIAIAIITPMYSILGVVK